MGALVLWAVALCAWSLLVKVFPATLASGNQIGRLQAPFGYWNAIALCAAMGLPGCLWLGTRREAGRRMAALAVPALTLVLSVLLLSYSRSADLAAVVALGLWLIVVPLRLRAVAVLLPAAAGAAVISAWMLAHHALSHDSVASAAQDAAGHTFGIVIAVVLVLMLVAGIAVTEAMDRTSLTPETRRRAGNLMLALLMVGVIGGIGALATSSRGLFGEIGHGWHTLTNPNASVSAASASRVFQFGSSRPLYWHQALFVGDRQPLRGVGELGYSTARLLDPTSVEPVFEAHSYVFQTYADLGVLGLALTAALLVAWLRATARTLAVGRGWSALDPSLADERIGLITLALLVIAFGVQGTLDWTWFFTGLTVPALLAAGALAGRGPSAVGRDGPVAVDAAPPAAPAAGPGPFDRPGLFVGIAALVIVGILGCWMVWRPLQSAQLLNNAENTGSLAAARGAVSAEPYSLLARQTLSSLYMTERPPQRAAALAQLRAAVHAQPDSPYAWEALAILDLQLHDGHGAGMAALRSGSSTTPATSSPTTTTGSQRRPKRWRVRGRSIASRSPTASAVRAAARRRH